MGALDTLLAQSKTQQSPSQVAAQEQKSSTGSALDNLMQSNGGKFVQPKPAAPVQQQKVQQPPQTNYFQAAIDAITSTATKAINAIQGKNFVSPIPQNNIVPDNQQNPIQTKPIANTTSAIKPDLGVSGNTGSSAQMTTTPQSIQQSKQNIQSFNTVSNVIDTLAKQYIPVTRQAVLDLNNDPFSLKSNPTKIVSDVVNSIKDSVKQEAANINNYINAKTPSTVVGTFSKTVAGSAGVVLSPITALFNGANDIPILGTLSKMITLPFTAVGEGATDASNAIIDKLPLSQATKDNIKPGIGEILSLAAQIYLGKVTDLGGKTKTDLTQKYGEQDANTISSKAQELASNKQQAESNKPSNTVELTPQQARAQVQATDLKGTPAGDVILKAANEAEAQGKSLQINTRPQEAPSAKPTEQKLLSATNPQRGAIQGEGFTMSDKADKANLATSKSMQDYTKALDSYNKNPTPAKLEKVQQLRQAVSDNKAKSAYSAKTPQGNTFDVNLVEPTVFKQIDANGKPVEGISTQILSTGSTAAPDGTSALDALIKNPNDTTGQPTTVETPTGDGQAPTATTEPTNVSVPRNQLPVGEGKEKVSSLDARVADALKNAPQEIKDKLGTATFNQMSKEENITKASKYVLDNPDDAVKVLKGEKEAPPGILRNSIYVAMTKMPADSIDLNLARKVASLTSTRAGQEISILTELDKDSPIAVMSQLAKDKIAIVEKKTGKTVSKAVDDTVKEIKKSVPKAKKEDWSSFIQSIQC